MNTRSSVGILGIHAGEDVNSLAVFFTIIIAPTTIQKLS
jgi:hypothetical protein